MVQKDADAKQFKGIKILGWLFTITGAMGCLGFPSGWLELRSEQLVTLNTPEYQFFSQFYLIAGFVTVMMLVTGVGLLKRKPWAGTCALAFLGLSGIVGTFYCVRFVQVYGMEWTIWVMLTWAWTIGWIGAFGFYLTRPSVRAQFYRKTQIESASPSRS